MTEIQGRIFHTRQDRSSTLGKRSSEAITLGGLLWTPQPRKHLAGVPHPHATCPASRLFRPRTWRASSQLPPETGTATAAIMNQDKGTSRAVGQSPDRGIPVGLARFA